MEAETKEDSARVLYEAAMALWGSPIALARRLKRPATTGASWGKHRRIPPWYRSDIVRIAHEDLEKILREREQSIVDARAAAARARDAALTLARIEHDES